MSLDTSPSVQKRIAALMKKRSGEERLVMGCSMFDSARELVLASLPQNATPDERRRRVFLRFYGNDFSMDQREKIVRHLSRI